MRSTTRQGFTLIELLIVVAIIAILAAIAVPNFLEAQMRSKIARTYADMRTLATAIESYRTDNQHYMPDFSGAREFDSWNYLTTPIPYISSFPLDPFTEKEQRPYFYAGDDDIWWPTTRYPLNSVNWIFWTWGPDLVWNALDFPGGLADDNYRHNRLAENRAQDFTYDPTNGTISYGDIYRTSKGFVGQY